MARAPPRSLARKFSDYLSILLVGPVLVFAAFPITASAESYWLVQRILTATHLTSAVVAITRHGAPFLLLVAAFTLLYRLLPYTRVTSGAALVGGVTAALLWHIAGFGFAVFVAGSASYAIIYSGFAVFLISLIWLQVAWLVVLTGGQVASVHQHPISFIAVRGRPSLLLRERVGLGALVEITRCYLGGAGPARISDLAGKLDAPLVLLEDLVDDFSKSGLLVRTTEPDGVVLARAPDDVTVVDILDAVREPPTSHDVDPAVPAPVVAALRRRDDVVRDTLGSVSLRSLATATDASLAPSSNRERAA